MQLVTTRKNMKTVGFEVLKAVSTKVAVFCVVAPCSLVEVYQRFRGPCCLHHQGIGATTQKTAINMKTVDKRVFMCTDGARAMIGKLHWCQSATKLWFYFVRASTACSTDKSFVIIVQTILINLLDEAVNTVNTYCQIACNFS
jgi:hypothetical protein